MRLAERIEARGWRYPEMQVEGVHHSGGDINSTAYRELRSRDIKYQEGSNEN